MQTKQLLCWSDMTDTEHSTRYVSNYFRKKSIMQPPTRFCNLTITSAVLQWATLPLRTVISCLSPKSRGILLRALPKVTISKLARFFSTIPLILNAKQENCEYQLFQSFIRTQWGNKPKVYQLWGRYSINCYIMSWLFPKWITKIH